MFFYLILNKTIRYKEVKYIIAQPLVELTVQQSQINVIT